MISKILENLDLNFTFKVYQLNNNQTIINKKL